MAPGAGWGRVGMEVGVGLTSGCLILTYAKQNICVENNPISQADSLRPRS